MKLVPENLEEKVIKNLVKGDHLEIAKGIKIYSVMSEMGEIVPILEISESAKKEINKYKKEWNTYSTN